MDSRKLIEERSVSGETKRADSGLRMETVKLVEMGNVSVETKGTVAGLEMNLTPRYG
jgi:hypothetical protein